MPFSQWILLNVPTAVIGLVMFIVAVGIAVGGVLLVRRYVDVSKFKQHHDIAGPIFSTVGVIYAVMLAFVLVVVWQDFDRASNNVVKEATCYAEIDRDSIGLSEPFRSKFRAAQNDYIDALIDDEWKLLAVGKKSPEAQRLADNIWNMVASYEPGTEGEKAFFAEMLNRMNNAVEMRRQRLVDSQTGIHPALWFVLLFGGIITVAFTFFFGSENLVAQLIMTTLLAMLIVSILFTILVMDFPFSGDLSISPDALQLILLRK